MSNEKNLFNVLLIISSPLLAQDCYLKTVEVKSCDSRDSYIDSKVIGQILVEPLDPVAPVEDGFKASCSRKVKGKIVTSESQCTTWDSAWAWLDNANGSNDTRCDQGAGVSSC